MKFSSSILFLGCWLTGDWWIVTGKVYEIPTIQVAPSSVVPFGGSFNITCNVKDSRELKYQLYFFHQENTQWTKLRMFNHIYFKHNAKYPDGGSYKCSYCLCQIYSELCSYNSNTIDVIIRDYKLLKPTITMSRVPSVNENVTIKCKADGNDLNFTLHRFGNPISVTESSNHSDPAKFPLSSLKLEDGGIYTCEYSRKGNRFVLSGISDPLELNLYDSSLMEPTIELRPKESTPLGRSVTIECQGPESGLNISLQQPNSSTALWLSETTGNTTKFFLAAVKLDNAGNYTCRYHHRDNRFVWSKSSKPVCLDVRALPIAEVCIRLVVAILVTILVILVAAEAIYSSKKEAALMSPPE